MDTISKVSEWIKLSPRYLFPISLVTGFLLFATTNMLDIFGLVPLVSQYRSYIGVIFLLSTGLLFTSWLIALYEWLKERLDQFRCQNLRKERLHDLTDEERRILCGYIYGKTRTQYLNILQDGVVNGLVNEQIIYRSSRFPIPGSRGRVAFNIQLWAWKYLNQRPELLHYVEDE